MPPFPLQDTPDLQWTLRVTDADADADLLADVGWWLSGGMSLLAWTGLAFVLTA